MTNTSKIRKKAQKYEEGLSDDYLDNTPQNQLIWEHYEAGTREVIAYIREWLGKTLLPSWAKDIVENILNGAEK